MGGKTKEMSNPKLEKLLTEWMRSKIKAWGMDAQQARREILFELGAFMTSDMQDVVDSLETVTEQLDKITI